MISRSSSQSFEKASSHQEGDQGHQVDDLRNHQVINSSGSSSQQSEEEKNSHQVINKTPIEGAGSSSQQSEKS